MFMNLHLHVKTLFGHPSILLPQCIYCRVNWQVPTLMYSTHCIIMCHLALYKLEVLVLLIFVTNFSIFHASGKARAHRYKGKPKR